MNDYSKTSLVDNKIALPSPPVIDGVPFYTERVEFVNRIGKKTVAYLDTREGNSLPLGMVLIPPAYGETKENNLLVSAYLAVNGFCGVRFDWTDHVGESEGEIFTSTLSNMSRDLGELRCYLESRLPPRNIGILATSLAARAALKLVGCDSRFRFLICFAPIVNVRETLRAVYREDLLENFRGGKKYGTLDILGFGIDADNFLEDAIDQSFADISSTIRDARRIAVPTFFFIGQQDSWVDIAEVRSVLNVIDSNKKELIVLPTVFHRLMENPRAAEKGLRLAVAGLLSVFGCAADLNDIQVPATDVLQFRDSQEKNHLRNIYAYSKSEERRFWRKYLGNFQYIIKVSDYYSLLESIYKRLGGAWSGQKILDAGCGIGNYGLFLLTKELYRISQNPRYLNCAPISYFGLDFLWDAISEASRKITGLQKEFRRKGGIADSKRDFLDAQFIAADLDLRLPLPDNFFDHVCMNLVLSYVQDADKVLRELWRVLRPGGKIVISSLKPNADLSEIYRNFIVAAETPEEIDEGRKLLSNAGMIRLKEVVGVYHFYNDKELRMMARNAGFNRIKTFHSFGNQANLVVCSKMQ